MAKAYSTFQTILKCGSDLENLQKLCRIKSYPDLSSGPESLEATDLEDTYQALIKGVENAETLEFTANYTPTAYNAIVDAESDDEQYYQLEFGRNASQGKFYWRGKHSVRVLGGDVNSVREMVISIIPADALTQILYYLADDAGDAIVTDSDKLLYVSVV